MAQKRPPNLNTAYGRRRARQEASERYQEMTPEQKNEHDQFGFIVTVVIIAVVLLVVYLFSGTEGLKTYLRR